MSTSAALRRVDPSPVNHLDPGLVAVRAGRSGTPRTVKGATMSNESRSPKTARAAKLSDTQLILLSAAAQRDDHCLTAMANLKGGAAQKVADRLVAAGLVREIKARTRTPVWRRGDETAQSFALKLTAMGLKAIAVDGDAIEEETSGAAHASSKSLREDGAESALADQGVMKRNPSRGGGRRGHSQRVSEGVGTSVPRSGSKAAEIVNLLDGDQGATIDELIAATGWLPHTTRAALTGLRKRGYQITCSRSADVTRYRIESAS
jgi:hypothetical protein